MKWFYIYLVLVNIIGFFIMGLDKAKAKKRAWRISEKTLFAVALLGGCLGTCMGMYAFRHKTKHWYFAIGMPMILIIEAVLVIMYIM